LLIGNFCRPLIVAFLLSSHSIASKKFLLGLLQ
jgi:hypothetical protein